MNGIVDSVAYDAERNVVVSGGGACSTVASSKLDGSFATMEVELAGSSVRLGAPLMSTSASCAQFVAARYPALGDSNSIFVLASLDVPVPSDVSRSGTHWTLLKIDLATAAAIVVASDFTRPDELVASVTSGDAFVAASRDGRPGIWKVASSTGAISLVKDGGYVSIAVSPDSHQLFVLPDGAPSSIEVVKL
jgi:hypothetical protein